MTGVEGRQTGVKATSLLATPSPLPKWKGVERRKEERGRKRKKSGDGGI